MVIVSSRKKSGGALPPRRPSKAWVPLRTRRKSPLQVLQIVLVVLIGIGFIVCCYIGTINIHFSRVGDVSGDSFTNSGSSEAVENCRIHHTTPSSNFKIPLFHKRDGGDVNKVVIDQQNSENKIHPPTPTRPSSTISAQHLCDGFSIPPPPVDKKRTGPRPCPVCYVPVEQAVALMTALPSVSPILQNLTYVYEKNLTVTKSSEGSAFGGYPSLKLRNLSFDIQKSMIVHCGFVKGKKPGRGTGFDIDHADLLEMEQCRGIVVASAIFGNFDIMQQPKNISETAKKSVCFYMFVDEGTEAYIKNSSTIDKAKRVGLWRVVVVRNLPYVDPRRIGKIPKLLLHRLFPNARYSLWIDGKLELVVDPYQILERFLWRENATFAISRHYKRFDVFEEAEANKAAGKYHNASIDRQVEFYKREGLTHYSPAKLPITSDVPEGCVIIREHTPISNLFTCLWFNEVDRFTSRDQISFSTVRDKIMSKVNWTVNMFKDCERRNFVIQSHHKDLLEQKNSSASPNSPPPPVVAKQSPPKQTSVTVPDWVARHPVRKPPTKHVKDRKSSSKPHHPRAASSKHSY